MGRELKRVSLGFNHPLEKVWPGYLGPTPSRRHRRRCAHCDGSGSSELAHRIHQQWYGYVPLDAADAARANWSPEDPHLREVVARKIAREPRYYGEGEQAVTREASRMCGIYNQQLSHNLSQADVDALLSAGHLREFTHTFVGGVGWTPKAGPAPTADEVNRWGLCGFGLSGGLWAITLARCKRAGVSPDCPHCHGEGERWASARVRARFQKWSRVEPPEGPGYQLWETVSEGSPVSPVFEAPEDLARWLVANPYGIDKGTSFVQWMRFITGLGWAPTAVITSAGTLSGVRASA